MIFISAGLLAGLGLSFWWSYQGWHALAQVEISSTGMIALIAGIVLTLSLAGGLIALMMYSHKKGYDDQIAGGD